MTFNCLIGLHTWNGCNCSVCGKTRDNHHQLDSYGKDCKYCGKELPFEQLVKKLKDKNIIQRLYAINLLGKLNDKRALRHLIRTLSDKDDSIRIAAAQSLGKTGNICAIGPLTKAIQDENFVVGRNAASSLGKIADSSSILPLIEALENSSNHIDIRIAAVKGIRLLRDGHAINSLTKALEDSNYTIQSEARNALDELGIARSLESEANLILIDNNEFHFNYNLNYRDWSKSKTEVLLESLNYKYTGVLGHSVVEAYNLALELGRRRIVEAVPGLAKLLKKWNPYGQTAEVWYAIVWALGHIGKRSGVESEFLAGNGQIVPAALAKIGAYDILLQYIDPSRSIVVKSALNGSNFHGSANFALYSAIVLLSMRKKSSTKYSKKDANIFASYLGTPDHLIRWAAVEALHNLGISFWKESLKCDESSEESDWEFLMQTEHPSVVYALLAIARHTNDDEIRKLVCNRLMSRNIKDIIKKTQIDIIANDSEFKNTMEKWMKTNLDVSTFSNGDPPDNFGKNK